MHMQEDFMTEKEIQRERRNERICERFQAIREQNPRVSSSRIIKSLQKEFSLCYGTINYVLKLNGVCLR